MKRKITIISILAVAIIVPYVVMYYMSRNYEKQLAEKSATVIEESKASFIVIDKNKLTLTMYGYDGKVKHRFPIACGKNIGDKQVVGDMKTPEGVFSISEIQDASTWTHDFHDGKGKIEGAYGSHFIRLETPGHSGIGIHGTHDPASIGTRATEGCIRLNNDSLKLLVPDVYPGMPVVITNDVNPVKS